MQTNPHILEGSAYYAWQINNIYGLNEMYETMIKSNDFLIKNAEMHSIYELDKPANPEQPNIDKLSENINSDVADIIDRLTKNVKYDLDHISPDQMKHIKKMATRVEYMLSNPTPEIEQIMWQQIAMIGKRCKIHMTEISFEIFERAGVNIPALLLTALTAYRSEQETFKYEFHYEIHRGDPKTTLQIMMDKRLANGFSEEDVSDENDENCDPEFMALSHNHTIVFEEQNLNIYEDVVTIEDNGIPEIVKTCMIGKNIQDIIESPFLPDMIIDITENYDSGRELELTVGQEDPRFKYQPICDILSAKGYIS